MIIRANFTAGIKNRVSLRFLSSETLIPNKSSIKQICNEIYALRKDSSFKPHVLSTLTSATSVLKDPSFNEVINGLDVQRILLGMRYCNNEHAEVNDFIKALSSALMKQNSSASNASDAASAIPKWTAEDVSMLYGLQSMSNSPSLVSTAGDSHSALLELVHAIEQPLLRALSLSRLSADISSTAHLCMMVYGLQNMRWETGEAESHPTNRLLGQLVRVAVQALDTAAANIRLHQPGQTPQHHSGAGDDIIRDALPDR